MNKEHILEKIDAYNTAEQVAWRAGIIFGMYNGPLRENELLRKCPFDETDPLRNYWVNGYIKMIDG